MRAYQDYLQSPDWKAKRLLVIDACHNVCERCGDLAVDEIHHVTYANLKAEPLTDLMGVCKWCHDEITQNKEIWILVNSNNRKWKMLKDN